MKLLFLLIALTLTLTFSFSSLAQEGLEQEEFDDLALLVQNLTKKFPANEYHYLGVGRSPTPIIALIHSLSPQLATNVPLSKFKYGAENVALRNDRISKKIYNPQVHLPLEKEMEEKLFAMLDIYFPKESAVQGKKILLIDYVDSGEGLVAATQYFQKYLEARGRTETLVPLALSFPHFQPSATPSYLSLNKIPTFNISKYPNVAGNMGIAQNYDRYGQFGSFDISKQEASSIQENPDYGFLLKQMAEQLWPNCSMSSDQVIRFNEAKILEKFIATANVLKIVQAFLLEKDSGSQEK